MQNFANKSPTSQVSLGIDSGTARAALARNPSPIGPRRRKTSSKLNEKPAKRYDMPPHEISGTKLTKADKRLTVLGGQKMISNRS